ncbi:MAG: U32 family peptidase, partial [Veillonella sp.]|nr:U32 family peptidase [Veillonella sp.]
MLELLAPAGSMENFIAALDAGADAIYLGGKGFNARAHAANFDIDLLEEAVRLAHIKGTAVYVTVNILIGDSEMKELAAYLKELERVGVDAILVQDLAVAELAQKVAP